MINYFKLNISRFKSFIFNIIKSNLSKKLFIYVISGSIFFSLIITIFNLRFHYKKELALIYNNIEYINDSYLDSISASVFLMEKDQTRRLIEGALKLKYVELIQVRNSSGEIWETAGNIENDYNISKIFNLVYTDPFGEKFEFGSMEIFSATQNIKLNLLHEFILLFASNVTSILITTIFILIVIYLLILRHLNKLANFVEELDLNSIKDNLQITKNKKSTRHDEIDKVMNALNNMLLRIREDFFLKQKTSKELKKSLDNKEVLIRELYHRTKNNMQVIKSLMHLQAYNKKNEKAKNILLETANKIDTMALVHHKLYESQNLSELNLAEYIKSLYTLMLNSFQLTPGKVEIDLDLEEIVLLIDNAVPLGLIINELILNAFKHAFPGDKNGNIFIKLRKEKEWIVLSISDNGVGLPRNFNLDKCSSLGMKTVVSLAKDQLHGDISFTSAKGTTWIIKFSDQYYKKRL